MLYDMKRNLLGVFILFFCSAAFAQKKPVVQKTSFKKDSFNIVKYGAIADGVTLNTKSINSQDEKINIIHDGLAGWIYRGYWKEYWMA